MNNIAVSFASLVKSNNGMFKSEAQAKFLLSQCQEENTFITSGTVYRNSFTLSYVCDAQGVVSVEKYLPTTGKTVTTWERLTVEQFEAKKADDNAHQARETESNEQSAAKFQARLDAFQNALNVAKAYVHAQMVELGVDSEMATRAVDSGMKDQDSITDSMDVLVKCPAFVEAWAIFNNEKGV